MSTSTLVPVSSSVLPRCILHATNEGRVIVIDVPQSIVEAQERRDGADLLSCVPISKPYQNSEPRAGKAWSFRKEGFLEGGPSSGPVNLEKCQQLRMALEHLNFHFAHRSYCLHRNVSSEPSLRQPRKAVEIDMSIGETDNEERASSHEDRLGDMLTNLASNGGRKSAKEVVRMRLQYGYPNEFRNDPSEPPSYANNETNLPWKDFVRNRTDHSKNLKITVASGGSGKTSYLFNLPPRSAFLLTKCEDIRALRAAAREYSPTLKSSRGRFDLIVLDPPWPNRSARRKGSYNESRNTARIEDTLLGLDLDAHIAANGFVAIWITNRPAIRELILGDGGLFEIWNVPLVEEWTWLKVTEKGEPIMSLDAHMRKPYETLLIGRSPENRMLPAGRLSAEQITHRTIVGTPDIHSRKPCLKYLFEQTLLQEVVESYTALEVFARYLVSGWMSWGDEAIKYNHEGFWKKEQSLG